MLISKNWIVRLLQNAGNKDFNPTDEELDAGFVRVGFETEGYAPLPEVTGPLVIGRVEEIEEPLMQQVRWMDKLVDELAKGKALEKILRG